MTRADAVVERTTRRIEAALADIAALLRFQPVTGEIKR